jgi:NAD(P)-dependent dehydrogenase (short-subunit alcohol dehydrogenase family)
MEDEDRYKVAAVDLSGVFFMSQAPLPHMLERGSGRIVNRTTVRPPTYAGGPHASHANR